MMIIALGRSEIYVSYIWSGNTWVVQATRPPTMWGLLHCLIFLLSLSLSSLSARWSKWKKIYCSKRRKKFSHRDEPGRRLPPRIFDFSFFTFKAYPTKYRFIKWFIWYRAAWKCEKRARRSAVDRTKSTLIYQRSHTKSPIDYRLWLIFMI